MVATAAVSGSSYELYMSACRNEGSLQSSLPSAPQKKQQKQTYKTTYVKEVAFKTRVQKTL